MNLLYPIISPPSFSLQSRLDTYKESVKPLTKEQVEAVAKYDEVLHQLELTKEYVKQFTSICIENDKQKKKQARKELQERAVADVVKIKQVLLIQVSFDFCLISAPRLFHICS